MPCRPAVTGLFEWAMALRQQLYITLIQKLIGAIAAYLEELTIPTSHQRKVLY